METKTTFIDHEVILEDKDLLELGQELGEMEEEAEELTAHAKETAADFKVQLSRIESRRKVCTRQLRDKKKTVNSECTVECDFINRTMKYKSVKTGRIVHIRTMTEAEYSLPSINN